MSTKDMDDHASIPIRIKIAFRRAPPPTYGEMALWRAVASRATLDALGFSGYGDILKHNRVVQNARNWFRLGDTVFVFEMASVDLKPVKEEVLAAPGRYRTTVDPEFTPVAPRVQNKEE